MCMKYEDDYTACFDYMMFEENYEEYSLKLMLRDWYGMKIMDEKEFRGRLFELFESAHEKGIVRPLTEEEHAASHEKAIANHRAYRDKVGDDDNAIVFYGLARI